MQYLVDSQLPTNLARWLDAQDDTVGTHVKDVGLGEAMDEEIWAYAKSDGSIIVTKDQDFIVLQMNDPKGSPILWVRLGNISNKKLIERFEQDFASIDKMFEDGERLVTME